MIRQDFGLEDYKVIYSVDDDKWQHVLRITMNKLRTYTFSVIVIMLCIQLIPAAKAGEEIQGAFGHKLGRPFDPISSTGIRAGGNVIAFRIQPEVALPPLSEFEVLVTPISYSIYGIRATGQAHDPALCTVEMAQIFQVVFKKYDGEEHGVEYYKLAEDGYLLNQVKTNRSISVRCENGLNISMNYLDRNMAKLEQKEHDEWNQLYSDYEAGRYVKILPRYQELARLGNMQAQTLLGLMHRLGQGVTPNDDKAEALYLAAAKRGWPVAQFNLGTLYLAVNRYKEAEEWLTKAANAGERRATYQIGVLHDRSPDGNKEDAFKWYLRAAVAGHIEAQYSVCHMYSAGDGVTKNDVVAFKWCDVAALQGHRIAAENRDHIQKRMAPEDIAQAREIAKNWLIQNRAR